MISLTDDLDQVPQLPQHSSCLQWVLWLNLPHYLIVDGYKSLKFLLPIMQIATHLKYFVYLYLKFLLPYPLLVGSRHHQILHYYEKYMTVPYIPPTHHQQHFQIAHCKEVYPHRKLHHVKQKKNLIFQIIQPPPFFPIRISNKFTFTSSTTKLIFRTRSNFCKA